MSARRCTCRCSPAPTGCCGRCAGPTAPSATSASSTASARPSRTPPSPPTSSSGSPARPRRTSRPRSTWCAQARFASAFTFQYSKRPGTPAAELDGQLPKAVVQERYQRLIDLQERISLEENTAQIGRTVELLVATGEGRKDASTARMSGGRATAGWCISHPAGADIRPGDIVTTTVTGAAPHHLIADGGVAHPPPHPGRRRARRRAAAAQRRRPRHARHRRARRHSRPSSGCAR